MDRQSRVLFVQPHLDDVGFACGGAVARAADEGERPVIIGVFTGPPPDGPLREGVRELHAKWGLGDDAWLARRGEDQRACAILGAVPMWLPYRDAPYRQGYETFESIFAGIRDDDPLINRIADDLHAAWSMTSGAMMYFPLGIGGHVDHLLCHAAGARLEQQQGVPVGYYEDYPYAAIPGLVAARLAALGGAWHTELVDVTTWIDRRIEAVNAYASQARSLFTTTSIVPGPSHEAVRRHAGALAGGLPGYLQRGPRMAECFYYRRVS